MIKPSYCNSLVEYSRFRTREVMVGKVGVGGDNPIRVQSMTTTDTMDTQDLTIRLGLILNLNLHDNTLFKLIH